MSTTVEPSVNPPKVEKSGCGMAIAIIIMIILLVFAALHFSLSTLGHSNRRMIDLIMGIGLTIDSIFFFNMLCFPTYISGNPGFIKMWPIFIGNAFVCCGLAGIMTMGGRNGMPMFIAAPLAVFIYAVSTYILSLFYIQDDSSPNYNPCLKPWCYKYELTFADLMLRYKDQNQNHNQGYPPVYNQQYSPYHNQQFLQHQQFSRPHIQGYPPQFNSIQDSKT